MLDNLDQVTDSGSFDEMVLRSEMPVMVVFYAMWCEDSQELAPKMMQLADQYSDHIRFYKVDIDQAQDLHQRFGIQVTPTVVLFEHGQISQTWLNDKDERNYRHTLDKVMSVAGH